MRVCRCAQVKHISQVKSTYVCVTGIHDIHAMFLQVSAGDNAAMPQSKQAARIGDGCSPFQEKLRTRGAFSSLGAVMAVLPQGLLSETNKGRSRAPQVLLRGELERTIIAAPLCMWPVSLCTLNSVQPACHVKGLFSSPVFVSMPCNKGS